MNADFAAAAVPVPRARWPRVALWVLLALCLLALWGAFTLIESVNPAPLQVSVNGAPLVTDLNLAALEPLHKVGLAIGLAVVLLAALLVALGGVLLALLLLVPFVLLSVALPVLIGGLLVALLLSPLLLVLWLLWRAVRPARARSTTMAA